MKLHANEEAEGQTIKEHYTKIKCCDCQTTYIGETGRNFSTRLTEYKHERQEMVISKITILNIIYRQEQRIDWVSTTCIKYSTGHGYY